ncbi:MAG: type II secretion system F family protein [Chloroflexota bacterium]
MVYQYVAYKENGELVKGKLSAASEEVATQLLSYTGYKVISLKRYVSLFNAEQLLSSSGLFQVKTSEVVLFYRQLAMLLECGTDIAASLDLLREQATNRALKKVLAEVLLDVRGGNQLSVSLGKHPKIFPSMYCRLLAIGEQSGNIEVVLKQVADYMEKEAIAAKQTKGALMMPTITFVVAIVVVGLLIVFVLPSFGKLYTALGAEMPAPARIMIGLGEAAKSHGIYVILGLLAICISAFIYVRTPGGKYNWDKLMLKLPLMGRLRHLTELARCCRSLALLFRAGLPLTDVMPLVIQGMNNKVLVEALTAAQSDMVRGEGLSKPMSKNKIFLPMMVQMVRVGEETGNLDTTLQAVTQSYEAEAADKMRSIIELIQPAMTIFLGLVVGTIAVTLMSAMTGMYSQIGG